MRTFLLISLFVTLLFSCNTKKNNQLKPSNSFQQVNLDYAKTFRLFRNSADTLEFRLELLAENGAIIHSYQFKNTNKTALKTVVFSSTCIGYLDVLQQLDKIVGVEKRNSLFNEYLVKKRDKLDEYIDYSQLNPEILKKRGVNIVFYSLFTPEISKTDQKLEKLSIQTFPLLDWKEKTALGKAEWIKVYGAVYGCYAKSVLAFHQIEKEYLAEKVKSTPKDAPEVLTGALFQDVWYLPGGKSFQAQQISDAGGRNLLPNDTTTGSQAFSFAQVYQRYKNVPIWINLDFSSKKELLQVYNNYRYFDAFKSGAIYGYKNMLQFFEESPVRPQVLLHDLKQIISKKVADSLYFYERLK